MTVRELRNNLVFWLSLAVYLYLFAFEFKSSALFTGFGSVVAAIVSVVLIAVVTDRFMDA